MPATKLTKQLVDVREAFKKMVKVGNPSQQGGGGYPNPNLLTGFFKNTQNAPKRIINT